jgi:hypothetical protein
VVTTNATPCCTPGTSSTQVSSVITITGLGDHDQPDWLITMNGIRTLAAAPDRRDGVPSANLKPSATGPARRRPS